jgi:hypothetical protein
MNVNVTRIDRLSNGMIQFYNGTDVVDSFSITSSVSVGSENNLAKTIVFSSSVKTLSFNVFNLTTLYGATSSKIYSSGIDPSDTSTAYISRLYDIYAFLISDVIQGCCPGPTFVGGVVAAYPDYFSFPAVGTPSVIYIDESTGIAYYWDAGAYHELVSGTAPTPLGYYGAWQDDITQTAAVDNTGYAMIFRTIDLANGISVITNGTNLTRITFAHTGVYNLQFSSQFQNTDNQEHDVTVWLRLNGVDVPGSSGFIGVPAKHGSVNGHCVVSWNYLLDVVGGQYYELMWSTTAAASVTMQFYAAGSPPPSAASVILTVTQQAGILAGTGITAINSLTGAVQTFATGTTGTDFGISSATSTHTFNLPTASAANRGALSSADWSTFNGKQNALGFTAENTANKQNSLAVDGTGVKFPTVDAVNALSFIDKGKRMVSFFTDFLTNATLDGGQSFASGGSLGLIVGSQIPNRTNQQGVAFFQTNTVATNYINYCSSSGAAQLWFGGGAWNYETLININTLSTALERYRMIFGFGSVISNSAETNGVFITYDEGGTANGTTASANWQCVTVDNSVRTLTTSTTAVTAAAWNKLRIEINAAGTSVTFYVNGTAIATHTTNIPLASNSRYVIMKTGLAKTIGITTRGFYCDYIGYENILTTAR